MHANPSTATVGLSHGDSTLSWLCDQCEAAMSALNPRSQPDDDPSDDDLTDQPVVDYRMNDIKRGNESKRITNSGNIAR
jgi:hypothetical protein